MSVLQDAIVADFARNVRVIARSNCEQIIVPFPLADSSPVSLYVTEDEHGIKISDRGRVATSLSLRGVDITAKNMQPSVSAILRATGFHDALAREDFELAVLARREEVAAAIREMTSAALRVDSLQPSKQRARTFKERLRETFTSLSIPIVPNAAINIGGTRTRHVTLAVESTQDRTLTYVQALSSADQASSYDRARSIFGDADIPVDRKVSVLQGGVDRWSDQPLENLQRVSRVVGDERLSDLATSLVA